MEYILAGIITLILFLAVTFPPILETIVGVLGGLLGAALLLAGIVFLAEWGASPLSVLMTVCGAGWLLMGVCYAMRGVRRSREHAHAAHVKHAMDVMVEDIGQQHRSDKT